MSDNTSIKDIAKALFSINRHAKTALEPQHLYHIKKETINKLLKENKAQKIGLHFSDHPKQSNQHSTLLIQVNDYYFHILPEKRDFEVLKHLGPLNQNYRNPRTRMSLSQAKRIVYQYIDWKPKKQKKTQRHAQQKYPSSYFTPSSLGKMEWPPKKTHRN